MTLAFTCAVLISVVYVFDVGAYPFVHVPFLLLTALYFGSLAEIYGLKGIIRWLRGKI